MKILIDGNLKHLKYYALDKEIPKVTGGSAEKYGPECLIQSFKSPKLLVDTAVISKLPAVKRDAAFRLLEFPQRLISYNGVALTWSDIVYPGVWAPSIDTILFANALQKLLPTPAFKQAQSFLEIGTGSGYLSKYIIQKKSSSNKFIKRALLMDINRDSLRCAQDNIKPLKTNAAISYVLNLPDQPIKVAGQFDLVLCNPPYVPRPHANVNNPFEGLFLYGEILRLAPKIMHRNSRLVINFSSLSKIDIIKEFRKIFKIKTIAKLKVPLKIPLITAGYSRESRAWVKYLKNKNCLLEDRSEKSGHRYWQIIEIVECRLK